MLGGTIDARVAQAYEWWHEYVNQSQPDYSANNVLNLRCKYWKMSLFRLSAVLIWYGTIGPNYLNKKCLSLLELIYCFVFLPCFKILPYALLLPQSNCDVTSSAGNCIEVAFRLSIHTDIKSACTLHASLGTLHFISLRSSRDTEDKKMRASFYKCNSARELPDSWWIDDREHIFWNLWNVRFSKEMKLRTASDCIFLIWFPRDSQPSFSDTVARQPVM